LRQYDFSQLGVVIRELREYRGFDQIELSSGICSQAQLSKIEGGISIPKATTLYLLAKKLGIEVNIIFEMISNEKMDYVFEYKKLVRNLVRQKNYQEVFRFVKAEESNPVFKKNVLNKQFIIWHKGICFYELGINKAKAVDYLNEALKLTHFSDHFFTRNELEIMNSIGVIYCENEDFQKAIEIYQVAISFINRDLSINDTFQIQIRIYYNYAKALTRLDDYDSSSTICMQALKICQRRESFYLLGELNYHIGYNHFVNGEMDEAKIYFDRAIEVFKINNKQNYIDHINTLIEK
jgi:tetratricopeptide (TPR) repeat protein